MVNFTKLALLAFGTAAVANPVEKGVALLEKRQEQQPEQA